MARILLVDDDVLIIKLYQVILKSESFDLDIAMSGKEMQAAIQQQTPDVILLDVVLPDSNGLDLCTQLKKDPVFSSIKIIMVSGEEVSPVQIAEGIELGADDYLVKPFHPKELLARVKNCLKLKIAEAELRHANLELKNLSNHLQHIREEERKIVAREVQEEIGQLIAAIKMDIDWLAISVPGITEQQKKRMEHVSAVTKMIIEQIRRLASSLRPSMIDELGLFAALEWKCRKIYRDNGIPCAFSSEGDDQGLPVEMKTTIFRICQEVLMNIVQHAAATNIILSVSINDKSLTVNISDDGKGFEINQQKRKLGLIGIRERASSINGKLSINSVISKGTDVSLFIPLQ